MKLLLDIKDDKAGFILELLKNFPFVKAEELSAGKAAKLMGLKSAIEDVKAAKQGKIKLKSAQQLLDEL